MTFLKRVFLDANTLVSGLVFQGPEHELLKKSTRGGLELVTSEDVIAELAEVINRKFPGKAFLVRDFLKLSGIRLVMRPSYSKTIDRQKVRDPEDRHVLAAALASGCRCIVSGDKDLLSLGTYKRMEIRTSKNVLRHGKQSE